MSLRDLPIVPQVIDAGPDNRIFHTLLLLGPVVIGLIVMFQRSLFTEMVAMAYIAGFLTYTLYRGIRG